MHERVTIWMYEGENVELKKKHDFAPPRQRSSTFIPVLLPSFLLTLALLLAGCAGPQQAADQAREQDEHVTTDLPLVRRMTPFPVRDAVGQPYDFPFLGGLDVPRPQFVDIDADDDPDLFLQERSGRVMFFENTGTPAEPTFTWRTSRYQDLPIGEWYRFAALDDDQDADLLAEQPYSHIRYYENTGPPSEPAFELAADTLKDASGEPLFSDRQNIPNVTDVDCDGQKDLFLGRLDGTITRYEETETDTDVPRFRLVTERFEDIEIVSQVSQPGGNVQTPPRPGNQRSPLDDGGSSRHGANTMTFTDVDDDGDQDLLWGDYFEPSLLLLENTGSCASPHFSEPEPFPPANPINTSGYNAPTLTDLDGDGDRDLFVGVIGGAFDPSRTAQDNLYYYEHTDEGRYVQRSKRFLYGLDVGSESLPALSDLDGDDDPDLLLANKIATDDAETARVFHFENQGTPTQPAFQLTDTLDLAPAHHLAPAIGDLDGDGDPDLLVGSWNDGIAFYRNEGAPDQPRFSLERPQYVELTRGSHSTPALVDIDDDGDLDLFVGETSGTINFYRNEGSPEQPRFSLVSDEYGGIDVGRRSVPAFLDVDGDGDQDLIVGSEDNGLQLFRNTGDAETPRFGDPTSLDITAPELTTPAFSDVDGDGDQDLFTGSTSGGLEYYENQAGR